MKKFLFAIALVAFIGSTPAVSYALSNDISIVKLAFANDDDKKKKAAAEKAAKKVALAEAKAKAKAEKASCNKGEKKTGCCSQKAAQ